VSIATTNWMLQHVPVQWLFMPMAIRRAIVLIAFRRMLRQADSRTQVPR
jgi:hypothetical protein